MSGLNFFLAASAKVCVCVCMFQKYGTECTMQAIVPCPAGMLYCRHPQILSRFHGYQFYQSVAEQLASGASRRGTRELVLCSWRFVSSLRLKICRTCQPDKPPSNLSIQISRIPLSPLCPLRRKSNPECWLQAPKRGFNPDLVPPSSSELNSVT